MVWGYGVVEDPDVVALPILARQLVERRDERGRRAVALAVQRVELAVDVHVHREGQCFAAFFRTVNA
jgi:hypothetical protein